MLFQVYIQQLKERLTAPTGTTAYTNMSMTTPAAIDAMGREPMSDQYFDYVKKRIRDKLGGRTQTLDRYDTDRDGMLSPRSPRCPVLFRVL